MYLQKVNESLAQRRGCGRGKWVTGSTMPLRTKVPLAHPPEPNAAVTFRSSSLDSIITPQVPC